MLVAPRIPWSGFLARWLLWTVAWSALLVAGYNAFRKIHREVTGQGFPPECKAAIQSAVPWSILLFALTLPWFLPRPGQLALRGRPWLGLSAVGASQCVLGLGLGLPVLASLDLSLVLGVLLGGAGWLAFHGSRRSWHALHLRLGGRSLWIAALAAALAPALALGVAQIARQGPQTLHDRGGWTLSKMEQDKALIGAVACFVTRKALARGRLDTSVWHGFQEVLRSEPIEARAVRCRFALDPDAYLVVRFGAADGPWTGVRLSRNARLPGAWLRVAEDGEFLEQRRLAFDPGGGWQDFRLEAGALTAGGRTLGPVPWPLQGPQRIGFRGGARRALVDEIEIERADGTVVREAFDLPRCDGGVFTAALLATALLGGLVAAAARRRNPARPALLAPVALGLPALLCVWGFAALDYWVLAGAHPWWIDYRGFQSRIETGEQVVERLRGQLAGPGEGPRVVVLGSSQTWGAGARREEHAWVPALAASLGPPWRWVGGGISGATSTELFAAYRREWASPAPRLVLVVLGNNDPDPEALRQNLTAHLALQRERGIPTVFVLEPNSGEATEARLAPNHRVLREVAAAAGVPVIDLPARLREHEDRGFLWWDHVHLSSCGHRLVARILREELAALGLPRLP